MLGSRVEVIIDMHAVHVRFKHISPRETFDRLVADLKSTFPEAVWISNNDCWTVSIVQLEAVMRFISENFAPHCIHVRANWLRIA